MRRPILLLGGREIGNTRVTIVHPLNASDVHLGGCDQAWLNDVEIPVSAVGEHLARSPRGVAKLGLRRDEVRASFELDFRLAEEEDLRGVEREFERMARGERLDTRSVEEFIRTTERFRTAIGYCDGICAYFYGVLARERAADSSLAYEKYAEKFSRAADELTPYDRPLARTIVGLVAFHFNHYRDAALGAPGLRLGLVADRFASWIESRQDSIGQPFVLRDRGEVEALVTDWPTERILRWAVRPLYELFDRAREIEEALVSDVTNFDRVKFHVLLGELHAARGSVAEALEHARAVRNVPELESWAEALIRAQSEAGDGRS
jgi:hypothetical protein